MDAPRLLRSRKADEQMTLTQVIGLVLAFLVILALVGVLVRMIYMFNAKADKGTENQFNNIYDGVEILFHPSNTNKSCKISVGYIEPGFAIVGFNKRGEANVAGERGTPGDEDYGYVEEHCGPDDNIYRPESCFDSACLCLCHGGSGDVTGKDCFGSVCKRFSDAVSRVFRVYDGKTVDLVLYGESCWIGKNNNVIAGYSITNTDGVIEVSEYKEEAAFETLQMPECSEISKSFRKSVSDSSAPGGPSGPAIEQTIKETKQGIVVSE